MQFSASNSCTSMQTTYTKKPDCPLWWLNPEPYWCEVTVPPFQPPCQPHINQYTIHIHTVFTVIHFSLINLQTYSVTIKIYKWLQLHFNSNQYKIIFILHLHTNYCFSLALCWHKDNTVEFNLLYTNDHKITHLFTHHLNMFYFWTQLHLH